MKSGCLARHTDGWQRPTTEEVQELLDWAGITYYRAAQLIGVHHTTVRRWTTGESDVPYPAWRLLLIETGKV